MAVAEAGPGGRPEAVVTGSDSGIGKATAVALAEAGFDVGVTWHSDETGAKGTVEEVAALGREALEGSSADCAAKGGLGLLTKVMALELAEHGILVNAIAPGEIATPMTGQHDVDPSTEDRPGIPLGRPGHAREIAAAIVHLASPEASYTTGASFVIDGGLLLMAAQRNR